jgi:hypothetical protein
MLATIKLGSAAGLIIVAGLFGGVSGNGKVKEETRQVGDFTGVQVSQTIEATVTLGSPTSVKIEGEENLLPLIKTEVKNGVLTTSVDGLGIKPTKRIRLTIVTPKLTSVGTSGGSHLTADATTPGSKFEADASGGSHITVKGVQADQLEVDASGASHITLKGSARKTSVDASGAAMINVRDIEADSIDVDVSGAAQVQASAKSEAKVDASGGALVRIKGDPRKKDVSHSGGASIEFE